MALPAGWTSTTVGQCTTMIRNGIFARRPNDEGLGIPILRISAVRDGRVDTSDPRYVEGVSQEQVRTFGLNPGDVLMTRYNGSRHLVGISGLVPEHSQPLLHPDKLIRVVVDTAIADARFVNYQLQAPQTRDFLEPRIRTTAGQSGIAGRDVRDIPLVLPGLDEQQRIVQILEDTFSRLEAAVEYTRTAARRLTALAQAARQQAIDSPSSPMVPLSELVERIETGKSLAGTAPASDDEWGVIKVSAMTWGAFRPEENKRIPDAQANPAYEIHEGDVLVSRANTSAYVGASVLVGKVRPRLLLSDKSLRLVPRSGVDAAWLNEVLQAPRTRQQISALATGTKDSMRNVSQRALLSVAVPDTPSAQQFQVLSAARSAADSVRALSEALDRAERRAEGLRRALLAAAFAGRLTDSQSAVDGQTTELAADLEVVPV